MTKRGRVQVGVQRAGTFRWRAVLTVRDGGAIYARPRLSRGGALCDSQELFEAYRDGHRHAARSTTTGGK